MAGLVTPALKRGLNPAGLAMSSLVVVDSLAFSRVRSGFSSS
ncbi:hypothetical protein FM120_21210 [Sphingobacterium faecium PCAi_F2.5]|nr:hypothetical protein FM120_21210 [Sphingobacterium faecium PCAi_F2.5]